MVKILEIELKENSIIDVVVPPFLDVHSIINDLSDEFNHVIIIDTKGNLYKEYKRALWLIGNEITHNDSSTDTGSISFENYEQTSIAFKRVDYTFVDSFEDFKLKLESLKKYKNYILLIDSITFVCDVSPMSIRSINTLIWSIIYTSKSTAITINHYRYENRNGVEKYIPRMGDYWSKFVSYQIFFRSIMGKISFVVNENKIEDY